MMPNVVLPVLRLSSTLSQSESIWIQVCRLISTSWRKVIRELWSRMRDKRHNLEFRVRGSQRERHVMNPQCLCRRIPVLPMSNSTTPAPSFNIFNDGRWIEEGWNIIWILPTRLQFFHNTCYITSYIYVLKTKREQEMKSWKQPNFGYY